MKKTIYSGSLDNLVYIEVNGVRLDLSEFASLSEVTYDFPEDGTPVTVDYKFVAGVSNLDNAFKNCDVKSFDFSQLDTKAVVSSKNVFANCKELTSDNPVLITLDNSLDVSGMFAGCDKLAEVSFDDVVLGKAQNMASMFNGCSSLVSVADMDMASVTDVTDMFVGCDALDTVEVAKAPVANVDLVLPKQISVLSIDQRNGGAVKYFVEHVSPKPLNIEDVEGNPILFDSSNVVKAVF